MDFIIFITTGSNFYYPVSGTYDWRYCGPSRDEAQAAYDAARTDETYIIGIKADGEYEYIASKIV